jgi:protein-disulfide isomerase
MKRNRMLLLAAVAGAAVVVAVVLIAVGARSDSSTTTTVVTATSAGTAEKPFLAGIPQRGDTLGKASAPATLAVFEDPQCPFCREWAIGTLPAVVDDYVRTGRLKLVYRGIQIIGPNSQQGLRAIYAAGRQNKLWNLADALYRRQGAENSGWITDGVIRDAAAAAGANGSAILAAAPGPSITAALAQAAQEAATDGVRGTPTFILQQPPGLPQPLQISALDTASFESALEAALQ